MLDNLDVNLRLTDPIKDVAILPIISSIIKNLRVSECLSLEKSENFENLIFSLRKVRNPFVLKR